MIRVMRTRARAGGAGRVELAVHNICAAKGWYRRLGFVVCRWWERTERDWELRGEGLYVPEKPTGEDGKTGGVIMRTAGGVLDGQLRGRSEGRGGLGGDKLYYHRGRDRRPPQVKPAGGHKGYGKEDIRRGEMVGGWHEEPHRMSI